MTYTVSSGTLNPTQLNSYWRLAGLVLCLWWSNKQYKALSWSRCTCYVLHFSLICCKCSAEYTLSLTFKPASCTSLPFRVMMRALSHALLMDWLLSWTNLFNSFSSVSIVIQLNLTITWQTMCVCVIVLHGIHLAVLYVNVLTTEVCIW